MEMQFREVFQRWALRVSRRRRAGGALAGLTVSLLVAVIAAAGAWYFRIDVPRPLGVLLAVALVAAVGALVGTALAHRRRWSDGTVALYLDQQLASDEAIATAIDLDEDAAARPTVMDRAQRVLRQGDHASVGPRVWRRWHAVGPVALGITVWLSLLPLPPGVAPAAPPPGVATVTAADVDGLDEVIAVRELTPADEAQRRRLDEIAARAERLRERLNDGLERREAQAEIADLRDQLQRERQRWASGAQRRGLEAALDQLGDVGALRDAQRALGERDLGRFDQEMERLANRLEDEDRQEAKKALEEAERAAAAAGAPDVAKELAAQRKRLEEQGARAQMMRDLAEAFGDGLSPEAAEALRELQRSGDPAASQNLGRALADALSDLTPEQRQKLGDRLREMARNLDPDTDRSEAPSREQLEAFGDQLDTPEGRQQLAERLRELAEAPPPSPSPGRQRQEGLGRAERGLGQAQRQLGLLPGGRGNQPGGRGTQPGGQGNQPGGQGNQPGGQGHQPGGQGNQPGGQGHQPGGQGNQPGGQGNQPGGQGRGGGDRADRSGFSRPVDGDALRAHADARMNAAPLDPGVSTTRGPHPGGRETANRVGTGALGRVGADEVGHVERSEVPREYREQVSRYFRP
ncbi:MAG: hypothetical protein AAGN82_00590 [Myxococcota bacterium]